MSTSHLPRDKKDRSVRARKHDPYKTKGKPREPSVCRGCKAVYHKGRWTWGPVPANSHEVVCPACERIRDGAAQTQPARNQEPTEDDASRDRACPSRDGSDQLDASAKNKWRKHLRWIKHYCLG